MVDGGEAGAQTVAAIGDSGEVRVIGDEVEPVPKIICIIESPIINSCRCSSCCCCCSSISHLRVGGCAAEYVLVVVVVMASAGADKDDGDA